MQDFSKETSKKTPLFALHEQWGGKLVDFAGYQLPIQYKTGILKEHRHCRADAALFDVSHMGQLRIDGNDRVAALERLVPGDIAALEPGASRYTFFTNQDGGILDDLMVTNAGDHLFLVVNAACKADDLAHLEANLTGDARVRALPARALIALQGPKAVAVLARHAPDVAALSFMHAAKMDVAGIAAIVSRSGYTGEDGVEISVAGDDVPRLASLLVDEPEVEPAGLGARDTLRLEAGLCLYGHDLTPQTTPIEAGLTWAISKRRRSEGGFPGDRIIQQQLEEKPGIRRVGILPSGRSPVREGAELLDMKGNYIGEVTSGGFGPTLKGPLAMGYIRTPFAKAGTVIGIVVREVVQDATITKMPFVPHQYFKK